MGITDRELRGLKPAAADYKVADGEGLYIRVQASGRKSFVLRRRVKGRDTLRTLGVYPDMTLAQARNEALRLNRQGSDAMTLDAAFLAWSKRLTIKTADAVRWRMKKYVLPELGQMPLAELHRRDVARVLTEVADRAPASANKALGDIKQLMAYAAEVGWIETSPLTLLTKKAVGGEEPPKDRVLTDEELRGLIATLRSGRFAPKTTLALALCLVSGQRSGEVRGIERVDVVDGVWRLPKEKTKQKVQDSTVELPRLGRILLRAAFTFGDRPFDEMANQVLSRAVARLEIEPRYTPHDLRRTMATRMADMGVFPHVIEKCLNHKMAGVMATYNRGEYLPEKKAAWRMWVKYLLRVRKEANR